jgi:hypothetical protein
MKARRLLPRHPSAGEMWEVFETVASLWTAMRTIGDYRFESAF